jgi:bile acid:Na+ symporter, BASS family
MVERRESPDAEVGSADVEAAEESLVATVVLPIGVAIIMASLGLSLTVEDFRRVIVKPRGVAIGLTNLLLISPFLAFGTAELFGLEAGLAVGLVLLGASPGGAMANMLTHLARGDTALSITMTAISSVAAVVTVPLFLELATDRFGSGLDTDINMAPVVARVFLITIVPLALGMAARRRWTEWVVENYELTRRIALGVFVAIVIGAVAAEHQTVLDNLAEVAAATIALNVAAMTVSFSVAKLARLDDRQATAIAMELGIHNASLAIAVGAGIAAILAIPAAVYSSFMFISAGLFARLMYKRNGQAEPVPAPAGAS